MPRIGLAVLSLCLVGCATSGDRTSVRSPAEPSDEQVAEAVKDYNESVENVEERVVCTRQTVVGTHFSQRICKTVRQLEEGRDLARERNEDAWDPAPLDPS